MKKKDTLMALIFHRLRPNWSGNFCNKSGGVSLLRTRCEACIFKPSAYKCVPKKFSLFWNGIKAIIPPGYILLILIFASITGLFLLKKPPAPQTTLRVMVYSSFVNVFGPGPLIKKEFEQICDCRIKWLKVPDSTLIAGRLSLKKDGFKTDVVLGLDQISIKNLKNLPWKPVPTHSSIWPPLEPNGHGAKAYFMPYNWSPMSFLSRIKRKQAMQLTDLLHKQFQHNISLPSPASSTVGLQFYYWIWSVFQDQTEAFLKAFKTQLYGLSPSWSTSYALFQRGHVDLSFSYLSSLLYHRQQKQKDFYFVFFEEGHPFQVEMAGVSGFCTKCTLAQQFIRFLLTENMQHILKTKNYMLSAISPSDKDFPILKDINLISYEHLPTFLEQKQKWLRDWNLWLKGA